MDLLLLFDVDGTLLLSDRQGARSMQAAGRRVVGEDFTLERVEFAGRLDPLIWADGARLAGVAADDALHARFRAAYAEILQRRLDETHAAHTLPGVDALLGRLETQDGLVLGLLTGNYPETGGIKLRAAGLDPERFPVQAWGSDAPTRRDLIDVARARYERHAGAPIDAGRVVVIGDTVHDVDCAHHSGCVAIAVGTGPSYDHDALLAHEPELFLPDLTDAERFVAFLASLRAR